MEFKKNIKNRYFLFYSLTVVICFLLGYVLLLSLDKIAEPSIGELYISVYTVFTQLGMLIFPVLVIQTFSTDYKGKNVLFYKLMGYNWILFFLRKVGIILFWFSLTTIAGILTISAIYGDFAYTLATIFYFECTLLYEVLFAGMWGFLIKSVIGAYVINFSFWLFAMVASVVNPKLSFLVRYDASNPVFLKFNRYFITHNNDYLEITNNIIYIIVFAVFILLIIYIFRRRWEKNGI